MRVIATIDGDLSIAQSAHHWDFFPNLEKRLICCFTDIKKVALCDQIPHHSFRNANSRLSVESENILNDWAVGVNKKDRTFAVVGYLSSGGCGNGCQCVTSSSVNSVNPHKSAS